MSETNNDWRARADDLQRRGGVPEKRAKVIALVEAGRTHAEVADELGLKSRGEVGTHVQRYRQQDKSRADWLSEHGPDL